MDQAILHDDGHLEIHGFKVPDAYAPSEIKIELEYGVFMGEIGGAPVAREGTTRLYYHFRHSHSGNSYVYDLRERDGQGIVPFFSDEVHMVIFIYADGREDTLRMRFPPQFTEYPIFICRTIMGSGAIHTESFDDLKDCHLMLENGAAIFVRSHEREDARVYQEIRIPEKYKPLSGVKRVLEI